MQPDETCTKGEMILMRNFLIKNILLAFFALFLFGCGYDGYDSSSSRPTITPEPEPEPEPKRIMPLGDSITFDWRFDDTRTDAERSGYRNYLWYKLENAGYSADFVGSRTTGAAISPPFDGDNEGHPGWTSYQLSNHVYNYLQANATDVVLLYIGTNDMGTSVSGVEKILDEVDRSEKDGKDAVIQPFKQETVKQ